MVLPPLEVGLMPPLEGELFSVLQSCCEECFVPRVPLRLVVLLMLFL
jgi:hypothetical protein